DSLAAAIEFSHEKIPLSLVSHRTHNSVTRSAQNDLVASLKKLGRNVEHHPFFVSSRDTPVSDHDVETSQRTRSFLFLILAALVARRTGRREILYMAENGQMAIHLPLTEARLGAFSTHTAHPEVLLAMQRFLCTALQYALVIKNPYVERTKSEVVKLVGNSYPELIPQTSSCW